MKNYIKIILSFILLNAALFAQGGSVYSRYGIGDVKTYTTARQMGLGGVGYAMRTNFHLNTETPSQYGSINQVRFYTGYTFNTIMADDGNLKNTYSSSAVDGFALGFPISKAAGMGLVLGYTPYSKINYEIDYKHSDTTFTKRYFGEGGMNKLFIGLSYSPFNDFTLGAMINYYNGRSEYFSELDYVDNTIQNDTYFSTKRTYNGAGFKFSLLSNDLASFLNSEKLSELRIAVNYSLESRINTDTSSVVAIKNGQTKEITSVVKTTLPFRLELGISALLDKSLFIYFDYTYQPFSKLLLGDLKYKATNDFSRVSAGVETNKRSKINSNFWDDINYRAGLSYEKSSLAINGTVIDKLALHCGLSLPLSFDSSLDIGLEAGKRGTLDNNLIKENFINVSVGFNIGDIWFVRYER